MSRQMTITIRDEQADLERLDQLGLSLRRELLDLGVDDVVRASGGDAPSNTRAVDMAAIGVLLVAFQESLPMITGIVTLVRSWLSTAPAQRSVEFTIGDQTLRIDSASLEQQDRLIDEFVAALHRREQPATPEPSPAP